MLSDTKFLITDRVSRNVLQATIDEQSMRIRKLKEILVETVCFGSSNMDAYYKHYLLVEEYNSCNRRKEDLSSFY